MNKSILENNQIHTIGIMFNTFSQIICWNNAFLFKNNIPNCNDRHRPMGKNIVLGLINPLINITMNLIQVK